MPITKKVRLEAAQKQAHYLAVQYRAVAEELMQAALVLDAASSIHSAYPVASANRFADLIKAGAVLHFIVDGR